MANSTPNKSLPPKNLSFKDEDIELTMSYGMLSEILKIIGDQENAVMLLMSDDNVRDYVICRLFTPTKEPITEIKDLINPYEIDLDPLKIDEVVAWVADHITHFTISTARRTQAVVQKYEGQAASLDPSKNGSQD